MGKLPSAYKLKHQHTESWDPVYDLVTEDRYEQHDLEQETDGTNGQQQEPYLWEASAS